MIFHRASFTEMHVVLSSDESLGVLDSDYIEDYTGTDGYLSLRHLQTMRRFSIPMAELLVETPEIPHDVFSGFIELSEIPDGEYRLEGRVRDVAGNYVIIGAFQDPRGDERVVDFESQVAGESLVVVIEIGPVRLLGGYRVYVPPPRAPLLSIPATATVVTIPPTKIPVRWS